MAWITDDGVHINMEKVRFFWWTRIDANNAVLLLDYGEGDIKTLKDPFQIKYHAACTATGTKPHTK